MPKTKRPAPPAFVGSAWIAAKLGISQNSAARQLSADMRRGDTRISVPEGGHGMVIARIDAESIVEEWPINHAAGTRNPRNQTNATIATTRTQAQRGARKTRKRVSARQNGK
jgi:hypothetical protein